MNDTNSAANYTPIHSLDSTPATLDDFKAIPLAEYNQFVNGYAQQVLAFMALADQVSDSQFSDSNIPSHVRIVVPSLNIDLHLPLKLEINTVADTITSSIMTAKVSAATVRLSTAISAAIQAAKSAIDAANDAAASEARSVAEAQEAAPLPTIAEQISDTTSAV
jgi:hypothetical protein